ncbi:MAG: mechanosensitive ion channel family protein [Candidatus Micrarchaeota archaeon]
MGIELTDFAWVLLAFLVSFAAAKIIYSLLNRYAKYLTGRTRTTLDDRILEAIDGPLSLAIIVLGVYWALSVLPAFAPYSIIVSQSFTVAVIIIAAYAITKLGDAVVAWYLDEAPPKTVAAMRDLTLFLKRIFRAFIFVIAAIMILSELGIEVSPLLASLGIASLAVALAFQDTLANFFAGVYLNVDRPVRVGDFVKLETGEEGYVDRIGWRSTQIRMLPNNIVVVPNSKMAQSIFINYHLPSKEMAVVMPVSVSYDSDLKKVERVTVEVAKGIQRSVKGAVQNFEPFVRYSKFADSGIEFSVILRVNEFVDQYLVRHEFIKALHARYKKERIEIPYPKRDVYIRRTK